MGFCCGAYAICVALFSARVYRCWFAAIVCFGAEIVEKEMSLTNNQRIFCQEYSVDRNGTRAYLAAYSSVKKEQTAAAASTRLLRNVNIAEYIQQLLDEAAKRTTITVDRVLIEYGKLAFADRRKLFNENGTLKPLSEIDDDVAACIEGVKIKTLHDKDGDETGQLIELKLADRKGSLDSIGRHLGMFVDRKEITGANGGPIETKQEIIESLLAEVDGSTRGLPV